ncbi:hypothetical protein Fmac_030327 [Flemingia macrophylla]|uniref:Uncharacterized protein n=1 Tax=Flemingia macrophylla TaxID=520843 RepID=A0ABD1LCW1_9FABA
MGRAPCCDKSNVKRGPWSPDEDAILKNYLENHGTGGNWIALPRKAGLRRCGKSCRLRWLNYLRPHIKLGGFTEEEDKIICTLYGTIGSRQDNWWSLIAAQLPGRTDNDVKNHWNTKLKKKFLAENTSVGTSNNGATSNTSYISDLFSTSTDLQSQVVEAFDSPWFDSNHVYDLEQTPIPVPFPIPRELEAFDSGISCIPPPSKEASIFSNAACLTKQHNHTQRVGYDHLESHEDDPTLLQFVLEDLLNYGFASSSSQVDPP